MSMKRSRTKTYSSSRRYDDAPLPLSKAAPEPEKTWDEYTAGKPEESFVPYSMKTKFERGALIAHPKFGKGVVINVEDQRIDVLFADGKRKLGHAIA
jgi:hypothetical protein